MMQEIENEIYKAIELQKAGDEDLAESLLRNILAIDSNNAEALNLMGCIQHKKNNLNPAMEFLLKSVNIKPCKKNYSDLGKVYFDMKNYNDAISCYKNSIKFDVNDYDNWFYLAYSLKEVNKIDESIMAYQMALSLNPKSCNANKNLGNIYFMDKNNPEYTILYYKKLVELQPDNIDAKVCLGVSYLKTKNYAKGWEFFEARLQKKLGLFIRTTMPGSPLLEKPTWNGEPIDDKIIYVYYEGGHGDTIMFARFLKILAKRCRKVLFRPQVESYNLFKENLPEIDVLGEDRDDSKIEFDVHIPLMSLPNRLCVSTDNDIILKDGYIVSNEEKINLYKTKYFNNNKLKVGIKWAGNITFDSNRQIDLYNFTELFGIDGVQFYSLQNDRANNEVSTMQKYNVVDLGQTFNDFSDTAAAIENLDLIICNDTSVAHLAGAMGKTCWILLPFVQDWRWSTDLSKCSWYDSAVLFKQDESRCWESVFKDVREKLIHSLLRKI